VGSVVATARKKVWVASLPSAGPDQPSLTFSVAISGTTAIVGAHGYAKGAGRAYVFEA
jgi:hypothetical protein